MPLWPRPIPYRPSRTPWPMCNVAARCCSMWPPAERARARDEIAAPPMTRRCASRLTNSFNLKAAVGRDISVAAATAFQSQVASPWLDARGSAQGAALEEGLESSREDFAPAMQDRQLLRIFDQATQELGDGA